MKNINKTRIANLVQRQFARLHRALCDFMILLINEHTPGDACPFQVSRKKIIHPLAFIKIIFPYI